MITTTTILLLCLAAFMAGFVDAIVGGGGLIQTPATLILLPQQPVASILGTVKLPSLLGTSIAAYHYHKQVQLQWRWVIPLAAIAFTASLTGSILATQVSNAYYKTIVLFILILVAIYTYSQKQLGITPQKMPNATKALLYSILAGSIIGFYDGFIGPGTGSFLVLAFVALMGNDFLHASAHAKLVNVATNLASILFFGSKGYVLWPVALPMAAANIAGNYAGVKLALLKGNSFVRFVFLVVVIATICRLAWDILPYGK
ncbi:MAG: sulfite exporter TauE/SafE family protein [Chitinophagaceae bacterium]